MAALFLRIDGASLTPCEVRILLLLIEGKTRQEIATALSKSESTIDSQMRLLYAKTRQSRLGALIAWAFHNDFPRLATIFLARVARHEKRKSKKKNPPSPEGNSR